MIVFVLFEELYAEHEILIQVAKNNSVTLKQIVF